MDTPIKSLSLLVLVAVFYAAGCNTVYADYDKGKAAYDNHKYATAYKEFAPIAKSGDPRAMRILGQMYRHGRGVTADVIKGTTWIHKAASSEFAPAQYDLGTIYLNMAVTRGQFAKADKWLTKASRQGHLEAQIRLGKMYRDGYGVEADDVKALVLFSAAGRKIKDIRGARDQLAKRMSKSDIARAKNMGMSIFVNPSKIKTFAESKKSLKDVKGKCGTAGKELYMSADDVEATASSLKNCLGKEWSGNLCSSQVDDLEKTFRKLNSVAESMKKDC
jgi:TPR repeat protein